MSEDVKNFLGVSFGVIVCILAMWLLVFGTWSIAAKIDDGPKEDARQSLYGNCSKQFKAGVFNDNCVTFVLEPQLILQSCMVKDAGLWIQIKEKK